MTEKDTPLICEEERAAMCFDDQFAFQRIFVAVILESRFILKRLFSCLLE